MEATRTFRFDGRDLLSLTAKRESYVILRDRLDEIVGELHIPNKIGKQILVMADEIFTNIAMHAYPDGEGTVAVSVRLVSYNHEDHRPTEAGLQDGVDVCMRSCRDVKDHCIELQFSDTGIPFNPLDMPELDVANRDVEQQIGGWGIHLVRQYADSMEYCRSGDRNVLTLKKFFSILNNGSEPAS